MPNCRDSEGWKAKDGEISSLEKSNKNNPDIAVPVKVDYKAKCITKDKEGQFIVI